MFVKYIFVSLGHFVAVCLALKVVHYVLPDCVTYYYTCFTNFIICVIAARLTFRFSKRKFLGDRIQPNNKAVLITGCDSGFGQGLAKRLDSKGFHVFATCLFPNVSGADDLRKSCSNRMQVLQLDVTKEDSVNAAVDFVKASLGKCELWSIVNNAGVLKGFSTDVTEMQDFKDAMDVNAFGAVRVTKAFLPMLKKSKGRVVIISSLAGKMGIAYYSPYTMSKFASYGFSDCLRRELYEWGVRVISIEPEAFQTPMAKKENVFSLIANLEKNIISAYGEKFLNEYKKFCDQSENFASPNIYRVLDDLERAICLKNPDISYNPGRNILVEEGINFLLMLPKIVQDVLLVFMNYVINLPKPEPQQ